MANNIVQTLANQLVDACVGTATFSAVTTPAKLALDSTTGTNTSAGTEISGGSYARATITFSAASSGAASNSAGITYSNMPAVTVSGVEVFDSTGTPRRLWAGALTASKTTASGDSLSFAASSVSISII